ncbi:MAG: DUF1851 domain-containing protein [Myxococcales bacterium]|nr:DUF1851 domain-containing protein [Myxococcales bacterium]
MSDNSAKTTKAKKTAKETPASTAEGASAPAASSEPAAKKATKKKATKKATKKKATAKKATKKKAAKKTGAKKAAKKASAKKTAETASAKKSAKKTGAKKATKKATTKKTAKKAAKKASAAESPAAKRSVAKTRSTSATSAKRTSAKRTSAKRPSAPRTRAKAPARESAPRSALNPLALAAALREALAPATLRVEHSPGERTSIAARMPAPFAELLLALGPGTFAGGFLRLSAPEALDETLSAWLGGSSPSRVPFAITALGDILYVRDLSERARTLGLSTEGAYDVSLLSPRWQRISVLAFTPMELVELLSDPHAREERLGEGLYREAKGRLGEPAQGELFGFVPALALGGGEEAAALQRVRLAEHLDFLRQLVG